MREAPSCSTHPSRRVLFCFTVFKTMTQPKCFTIVEKSHVPVHRGSRLRNTGFSTQWNTMQSCKRMKENMNIDIGWFGGVHPFWVIILLSTFRAGSLWQSTDLQQWVWHEGTRALDTAAHSPRHLAITLLSVQSVHVFRCHWRCLQISLHPALPSPSTCPSLTEAMSG